MTNKSETAGDGARGCDLAGSLVTYLYGEASSEEAALFERHASACALCRDELAAFAGVRRAVGEWRAEAVGFVAAPGGRVAPAAWEGAARGRSALAALRAFLALSPRWLQAGAAAAALAVCALAALTYARAEVRWGADGFAFRSVAGERVVERRVEVPVPQAASPEQVESIVAERLRQERLVWQAEAELAVRRSADAARAGGATAVDTTPRIQTVKETTGRAPRNKQAPRPTRRGEQLVVEDELPRLSDLLSEVSGGELD